MKTYNCIEANKYLKLSETLSWVAIISMYSGVIITVLALLFI